MTITIWEALMYGYSICIVYAMSCAYDVRVTYVYEWTCNMCTVTAGLWLLLAEALEGLVLLLTCSPCKMHCCSCLAESKDVKMEWDLNHLFWGVGWDTEEMNHCSRLGSAEPGETPVLWMPQLMLWQQGCFCLSSTLSISCSHVWKQRSLGRVWLFCDPMDCSLTVSPVLGISQTRILERVAVSFSWGSSLTRDRTWVSRIVGRFFTFWATKEACDFSFVTVF